MKKRTFLKTSSALIAGSIVNPYTSCVAPKKEVAKRTNWAGNFQYSAINFYQPETTEKIQELVRKSKKVRALGSRHCFNKIADCNESQISLGKMNRVIALDEKAKTVTIEGGMRYGELGPYLHEKGFALHNLASLPHISVAGACATGTHGSGMGNGNLPTAVSAMEIINGHGEKISLSRDKHPEKFKGAVVGLGSLGIVSQLTLDIEPTFAVSQFVYLKLPVTQLEKNFREIMGSAYSVSLFTDWQSDYVNQVWIKQKATKNGPFGKETAFYGAKPAEKKVHPIISHSPESCTQQMGIPGPWYNRLPHFRLEFTPSSGKELQTEYFIPLKHAMEAFHTIAGLREQIKPLLMISEIRSIDADDYWMSPCFGQSCIAFHFTWKQDWPALRQLLPVLEKNLEPFEVRPHWGKMFTMDPSILQSRYSRLNNFKDLVSEFDPERKFRNAFIRKYIFST